jgi:uncharacterized integral membrane protein (TIGR00697 family)
MVSFVPGVQKAVAEKTSLRNFKHYDTLVHIFVVVLLVSNIIGSKICEIGPFRVFGNEFTFHISGAQLLFPITYIFGDIFTEVYGYAGSRRAIWVGFFSSGLLAVMAMIAVALPPASDWHGQAAFAEVFNFIPRLVVASLVAFWCGEFANSFVMARLKMLTGGKQLWMRTISSTVVGQGVDTAIVMVGAFWGSLTPALIGNLILSGYLGKVLYEAAATPVTYLIVNGLKRSEGVDVYDVGTNFSPFTADEPAI